MTKSIQTTDFKGSMRKRMMQTTEDAAFLALSYQLISLSVEHFLLELSHKTSCATFLKLIIFLLKLSFLQHPL